MLDASAALGQTSLTVVERRSQDRVTFGLAYLGCIAVCLAVAALTVSTMPKPFSLATVVLLLAVVVAIARPVLGIYLMVFFAILGDPSISDWYPFTKNFSSVESILYVSSSVKFSPLEVFLVALLVGWVMSMFVGHTWQFRRGALFRPLMAFSGFLVLGLGYGLAHGGNSNVALWEIRPILYVPIVYVLVTNLFRRQEQYERLYWCVMVAVFLNSLLAYNTLQHMSEAQRLTLETLVSHGATLAMNMMFVLVIAAWLFKGQSWGKRLLLPVIAVPVFVVYLVSDRRAAIIGLVAAIIMLCVVLFWTRRRVFWVVVPALVILGGAYTAAFWHNANSSLAGPAQAVKAVIKPSEVDQKDQSSDLYRRVEDADIIATIRSNRLFGVGFGQKFLRPYTLPAITTFLLAEYITHNSILWIWMKAGIGGFIAMIYLFGKTLRKGAQAILLTAKTSYAAMTIASVAFVLVYVIFAYVDIGWDAQNMVLLGLVMAQIDSVVGLRSGRRGHRRHAGRVAEEPLGALELAGLEPEPQPALVPTVPGAVPVG